MNSDICKLKYSKNQPTIEKITDDLSSLVTANNLDFDSQYNIVKLTKHNTNIIGNLMLHDDDCIQFAEIIFKSFSKDDIIKNNNKSLICVLRELDRDKNTNVWRYKKNRDGIYAILDYIVDPRNSFFDRLCKGDVNLPDDLVKVGGTRIKSFASKVCKYLSIYMFDKDNYYINDSYIRQALLYYLDYYNADKFITDGKELTNGSQINNLTYKELYNLLEQLRYKSENLTRDEIDHIIWYCYRSFDILWYKADILFTHFS